MQRREVVAGLGIAAGRPRADVAQPAGPPATGFTSTRSPEEATAHTNAFRRGLEEMGYSEGRRVAVEYRWANGDYGRLPALATDLLSRPLSLVVGAGDPAAQAARAAGAAVPLIFVVGQDPVQSGLVESMNRPGKATGVNFFTGELGGKRLELLCAMVPKAARVGLLLNPRFGAEVSEQFKLSVSAAAQSLGRELVAQAAGTDAEIEAAFAALVSAGVGGLVVQNDPFFDTRRR